MTQVRIIPAVLSAAIVLIGFGYLAVGRAQTTDAPAAAVQKQDITEVLVVGRRS